MTNIGDAYYGGALADEPIGGMGNEAAGEGDSASAILEAAKKCAKVVMFEFENERNKRFTRGNDFANQTAIGFAKGRGRRQELDGIHILSSAGAVTSVSDVRFCRNVHDGAIRSRLLDAKVERAATSYLSRPSR